MTAANVAALCFYPFRKNSGSFATFAAILRASWRMSTLASMSALPPKADID
jgi:hypothetical protein